MSINEIIKKHLPVTNQKLSQQNSTYNYCKYYSYHNCKQCKDLKQTNCVKKLQFEKVVPINEIRWHLYFKCASNHQVIRWVIIDNTSVVIGTVKN